MIKWDPFWFKVFTVCWLTGLGFMVLGLIAFVMANIKGTRIF